MIDFCSMATDKCCCGFGSILRQREIAGSRAVCTPTDLLLVIFWKVLRHEIVVGVVDWRLVIQEIGALAQAFCGMC